MAQNDWTLAIDFGTSNSAAAHSGATSRGIETLPLTHTSNLMPSSVHVSGPQQIVVGDASLNAALSNPAGFVASPKRLISGSSTMMTVGGLTLPVAVPVAAVMRAIVERGKAAHAGQPPSRVVLTHPEAWAGEQVQVLIDGAVAAGIDPARISTVSEPRAAAAHYSRSHTLQPGARIAVFDFGGGTLDVAVLTVSGQGSFSVVAARGDNGLGGKNLDALIQRWVEERLDEREPGAVEWLRRNAPIDVVQDMQESIRRAKELLSEAPSATITATTSRGRQTFQITRDELDELIAPAIEQAVRLTRATLLDGGVQHPDQLTALYLTGGSSRIPLVQQRIAELGPVATLDDPKTVVAQGALRVAQTDGGSLSAAGTSPIVPGPYGITPVAGTPGVPAAPPFPGPPGPVPSGHAPNAPAAAPRPRPWGKIAAGTAAVVVVAGIVWGVIAASKGGGDTRQAAASSPVSAAPTSLGSDGIITDQDQLMAIVPRALADGLTDCKKSGFTDHDALEVRCSVSKSSPLAELGSDGYTYFVDLSGDMIEARSRIVGLRNGLYSQGKGVLVEDQGRTAAGEVTEQVGSKEFSVDYVSTASGLNVTVFGFKSIDAGKTFLTRSGLIR